MRRALILLTGLLLAGAVVSLARRSETQETPKNDQAQAPPEEQPIPPEAVKRENPVKPSPEGLAKAKRLFSTQCAMCHGADGDGKGELAESLKLELHDWRGSTALTGKTDGELFYIISNGKGKMMGQGDRFPEELRWNLVNYARSFAKKERDSDDKPKTEAPKP
jgi:mono/diheme cytochrome c family protein